MLLTEICSIVSVTTRADELVVLEYVLKTWPSRTSFSQEHVNQALQAFQSKMGVKMPKIVNEKVRFSLLVMPCCHIQLCWVNPRMPNYCPECGKRTGMNNNNRSAVVFEDDNAWLKHKEIS